MIITIISVGKLTLNFQNLMNDYAKKIEFYSDLIFVSIKEFNDKSIEVQKQKETEQILKKIPKNSDAYLLSMKGKTYDSPQFAKLIKDKHHIAFIIGGSHGVDESKFKKKISFSDMTFPHQMFKVMLIEQIFRGISINNNSKYHK